MNKETHKSGDASVQDPMLSDLVKELAIRLDKMFSDVQEIRTEMWETNNQVRELRNEVSAVNHWQKLALTAVQSIDKQLRDAGILPARGAQLGQPEE